MTTRKKIFRKKKKPSWKRWILVRFFWFLAFCILFTSGQVLFLAVIDPPFTVSTAWDYTRACFSRKPFRPPSYEWRDIEELSPHLQRAVLASEDQRFKDHRGFDYTELAIAIKGIVLENRVRGASTITMQTARSVYLVPSRSLVRKAAEAWYTLLIELFWSKHRILEVYLNTVDWGSGIMGAEAAAKRYFNQRARDLSPEQAALMAAILPSPHRWSVRRPDDNVRARQQRILRDMPSMPHF